MTTDEIVAELKTIKIENLRTEVQAEYVQTVRDGQVVDRLRWILVRVSDPFRSGCAARVEIEDTDTYAGKDAVIAALTAQIKANRKRTGAAIRRERTVS